MIRISEFGSDEYKLLVGLRDFVLRKPLNLVFTKEQLDAEENEIHIGYWSEDDNPLGVLLLRPLENGVIKMRQVAVHPHQQGRGIGQLLVEYSENYAKNLGYSIMELNARLEAVPFYEKLNYIKKGEQFTEVNIPHFKMVKDLN